MKTFIVDKSELSTIQVRGEKLPNLQVGEVLLSVEKFAFTSNNITYAVLGDSFKYWNFFPHIKGGIIPVWGYASVVDSKCTDIERGERYYGYLPMATHLIICPDNITPFGFTDTVAHRKLLPGVYNYYESLRANPSFSQEMEDYYAIFYPLFATSYLLEDYYREESYFHADHIFITSASSKTAIGFAYLMKKNNAPISLVGLTSALRKNLCQDLGCYDQVISYDQLPSEIDQKTAIVDFSGNHAFLLELYSRMSHLQKSTSVGMAHWDAMKSRHVLPFDSDLFFAPAQAKKRQKEWGGKLFKTRIDAAIIDFIEWASHWMKIRKVDEEENIMKTYGKTLKGDIDPKEGMIMVLEKY